MLFDLSRSGSVLRTQPGASPSQNYEQYQPILVETLAYYESLAED